MFYSIHNIHAVLLYTIIFHFDTFVNMQFRKTEKTAGGIRLCRSRPAASFPPRVFRSSRRNRTFYFLRRPFPAGFAFFLRRMPSPLFLRLLPASIFSMKYPLFSLPDLAARFFSRSPPSALRPPFFLPEDPPLRFFDARSNDTLLPLIWLPFMELITSSA